MKQRLFLLFYILGLSAVLGQYPPNLVNNPSFEDGQYFYVNCNSGNFHSAPNDIAWWNENGTSGTWFEYEPQCNRGMDTYCSYNPLDAYKSVMLAQNDVGRSGIWSPLVNTLELNKKYKYRILAAGHENSRFVTTFSYDDEWWDASKHRMSWAVDQGLPPNADICDAFVYESVITAQYDDLNYIVFQSKNDEKLTLYVYIDRVELYEYCTEYLIRQARIYKFNRELEEAKHIIAGSRIDGGIAAGDVQMLPGSVTIYKAESEVRLVEGFIVENGADFTAKIAPCGKECFSSDVNVPSEYVICDDNCISLIAENLRGMTYLWSSPHIEFMEYLSDINTPTPIFCPPSSINGTFVYSVTITNSCGESTTKNVYIHRDLESNPTPEFTILNSNLSSNPDNPALTISTGEHTEFVVVDILNCDGNILRSDKYTNGINFTNPGHIDWSMSGFMTPCACYKIRVRSKNYCYPDVKEEIYDWNRIQSPSNISVGNVTICRDGKRRICFSGNGIARVEFYLFNRWMEQVMHSSESFTDNPFCMQIDNDLTNGQYLMYVDIIGCDGSVQKRQTWVTVTNCEDNVMDDPDGGWYDDTYNDGGYYENADGGLDSLYSTISPNPVVDYSTIQYHMPYAGAVKISLMNANFEQKAVILTNDNQAAGNYEINFSNSELLGGINYYMIELMDERTLRHIKRFSVVK